jgi:hypothetical protein
LFEDAWTEGEEDYLRTHAGDGREKLARKLKRTTAAIRERGRLLGTPVGRTKTRDPQPSG